MNLKDERITPMNNKNSMTDGRHPVIYLRTSNVPSKFGLQTCDYTILTFTSDKLILVTSMLVTSLRCWWPILYIEKITNITKKVADIIIRPPTAEISHYHNLTNITKSSTSLSLLIFESQFEEGARFVIFALFRNYISTW